MIYEGTTLKCILVDGGYIEGSTYYYYLTDHLGNNRVVVNANGTAQQVNHYYPYGMTFDESTEPTKQPYKYGGKEFDKERSLNWSDFHARQYMNDVPMFTTMDPLVEKAYSTSPYTYCLGNPIKYVDPDGRREWPVNETYIGYGRRHENNFGAAKGTNRTHQGVDINYNGSGDTDNTPNNISYFISKSTSKFIICL
jgi:RHS repeat-associated protein